MTGGANLVLSWLFGILLAAYAYGIGRCANFALRSRTFSSVVVLTRFICDEEPAQWSEAAVGFAILAIGLGSIGIIDWFCIGGALSSLIQASRIRHASG